MASRVAMQPFAPTATAVSGHHDRVSSIFPRLLGDDIRVGAGTNDGFNRHARTERGGDRGQLGWASRRISSNSAAGSAKPQRTTWSKTRPASQASAKWVAIAGPAYAPSDSANGTRILFINQPTFNRAQIVAWGSATAN
jgi:hypothetical protein